jgi:hypothetical protein
MKVRNISVSSVNCCWTATLVDSCWGDMVMTNFQGVLKVGKTCTVGHEKKKIEEENERAEAVGEKEWLWIPLVRVIFKEMSVGKLKMR